MLTGEQIMQAYRHVAAQLTEFDNMDETAERLGVEPDTLLAVESLVAGKLDETLCDTSFWPPESDVQRMTGLGIAFGLGIMTALQIQRDGERGGVTHG